MEKNMRKEMEKIREKVHTTADAALFLCFQELNGSHSKGVIRLPLLHYDVPFAGYGEMLLRMNRIYDLLGMPDAGSCMRSLREEEKDEWEFTEDMKTGRRPRFRPEPSGWSAFRFSSASTAVCRDF